MPGGRCRAGLPGSIVGILCAATTVPAVAAPCPTVGETTALVAAVEPRLELRLADGRLLRLAGLEPASQTPDHPERGETARDRLADMVVGKTITFRLLAATPDRWGRLPALVFVADAKPTVAGLATTALAEGLGRYQPEPAAHACRDAFIAAEDAARRGRLGLWTDPYYNVLTVDDHAAFLERSGTNVVVEGLLTGVEPGPYRTTLRFAAPAARRPGPYRPPQDPSEPGSWGGHLLVATILPKVSKAFEGQGLDVRALIGRQIRFRGLLDLRFGARVELVSPDDIEVPASPVLTPSPRSK